MTARGCAALLLSTIVLSALSAAPAAAQTASKCTAQKYKAVGKYAEALTRCRAGTLAKGLPAETLCAAKAELKLLKAFQKAEEKGDCLGTRDGAFAVGETEDYLEGLTPVLESTLFCCSIGGFDNGCGWTETEEICTSQLGGTLGAEGTVCDAGGGCIAPPTAGGPCCSFPSGILGCQGGTFTSGSCQILGGTFVESGVCIPDQTCVAP